MANVLQRFITLSDERHARMNDSIDKRFAVSDARLDKFETKVTEMFNTFTQKIQAFSYLPSDQVAYSEQQEYEEVEHCTEEFDEDPDYDPLHPELDYPSTSTYHDDQVEESSTHSELYFYPEACTLHQDRICIGEHTIFVDSGEL